MKLKKMVMILLTLLLLVSCQSKKRECKVQYNFQICIDDDWYYNHSSYGNVYTKDDVFVVMDKYQGKLDDEETLFQNVKTSFNFWDLGRYKNNLKIVNSSKDVDGKTNIHSATIDKFDKEYVKIFSKFDGEYVSFVAIASKKLDEIDKAAKEIIK